MSNLEKFVAAGVVEAEADCEIAEQWGIQIQLLCSMKEATPSLERIERCLTKEFRTLLRRRGF